MGILFLGLYDEVYFLLPVSFLHVLCATFVAQRRNTLYKASSGIYLPSNNLEEHKPGTGTFGMHNKEIILNLKDQFIAETIAACTSPLPGQSTKLELNRNIILSK